MSNILTVLGTSLPFIAAGTLIFVKPIGKVPATSQVMWGFMILLITMIAGSSIAVKQQYDSMNGVEWTAWSQKDQSQYLYQVFLLSFNIILFLSLAYNSVHGYSSWNSTAAAGL